jgi:hypothetical protein
MVTDGKWVPLYDPIINRCSDDGCHPPIGIYIEFVTLARNTRQGVTASLGDRPPHRKTETVFLAEDALGREVFFYYQVLKWRELPLWSDKESLDVSDL